MKINKEGLQIIKDFEGCILEAYADPIGIPTIGVGATFYKNGTKVKMGDKITQKEADELLKYHVTAFEEDVESVVKVELNENQFSALVSFTFNCGLGNLKSSTLLRKLNASDFSGASLEFPRWNKAGGKVLRGLTKRRWAEQRLFNKTT